MPMFMQGKLGRYILPDDSEIVIEKRPAFLFKPINGRERLKYVKRINDLNLVPADEREDLIDALVLELYVSCDKCIFEEQPVNLAQCVPNLGHMEKFDLIWGCLNANTLTGDDVKN